MPKLKIQIVVQFFKCLRNESISLSKQFFLIGLAVFGCLMSTPTIAQDHYPNRPIRIILGFPAGGGTDAILRSLAAKLTENLGVPVIVENKPGANANIAGEFVAKAAPDGYTFLYNTSSLVLSPHLYTKLNYNFQTQLTPVALTANIPFVLATSPTLPLKNIQEFVDYLKANPGRVNYASAGEGNVMHLATILFLNGINAQATHIPYKGEAPGLIDLLGGQVQFMLGNSNSLIPNNVVTIYPVDVLYETSAIDSDYAFNGVFRTPVNGVVKYVA